MKKNEKNHAKIMFHFKVSSKCQFFFYRKFVQNFVLGKAATEAKEGEDEPEPEQKIEDKMGEVFFKIKV